MSKPTAPATRRAFIKHTTLLAVTAGAVPRALRASATQSEDELIQLTARAAVAAMRRGDFTAEAYAHALLARAERLKRLNAFCRLAPDAVLAAARAADRARLSGAKLGALHGLPLPVKDSVNTATLPTSNGTAGLRDFRPKEDAEVLKRLLAEGALLMGKTNLHEISLGYTSNTETFGAVRNPYDETRIPGGSSGGSAVAVAARLAPLAVAEDTLGSIRIPASLCGIAGLRPTRGRYPNGGIMPLTTSAFDQVGPVGRDVGDLILFDSAVVGDAIPLRAIALKGLRVGLPEHLWAELDPEAERVARTAVARLADAGAVIVPVKLEAAARATGIGSTIIIHEVAAAIDAFLSAHGASIAFADIAAQSDARLRAALVTVAEGKQIKRDVYERALASRDQIKAELRTTMEGERLSLLAFPPAMLPAAKIGEESTLAIAGKNRSINLVYGRAPTLGSAAGACSLVLPAGLTAEGLPVGLEFLAPAGGDRVLLAAGLSLEQALGPIPPAKV